MQQSVSISLVTPVFNGAKYLARTLESVRTQTSKNVEYIVCDGGSTDGTLEILDKNRDIISKLGVGKDKGMYDALMIGFSQATGDVFGWIGCDDILMPWCLNCVSKHFEENPQSQWVTGIPAVFDGQGNLVWVAQVAPRYRRSWIRRRWYSDIGLGIIMQECTFFRRELFDRVGGLDPTMKVAGDFDLWCRFAEYAELHQLGTVISGFRLHGSNLGGLGGGKQYLSEARAVRIPGGKVLGYTYSYLAFLCERWHCKRRLADMLPLQC